MSASKDSIKSSIEHPDIEFQAGSGLHVYDGVPYPWFVHASTLEAMKTFEVRNDDVYVISFPKSGTTWLQEIVSMIYYEADVEKITSIHVEERVPHLEMSTAKPGNILIKKIANMPRDKPRLIKTHMAFDTMPPDFHNKKAKAVYVARNYKDICVSAFHFLKMFKAYSDDDRMSSWEDYLLKMMIPMKSPYGSWVHHVTSWWQNRHDENVLFLKYEDMKRDLRGNVIKICDHLGKTLSEEALQKTVDQCTFKKMSKNPMANFTGLTDFDLNVSTFMRKGGVGDWMNHFTVAQNKLIDSVLRESLTGTGLEFEYEPCEEKK
ncbi:sulfotransferase 1E1-like [Antedon mediterranea]|uniref:sulfotransferase 1E1-like n=1 Tax=Antedon mediterranea TaxID=105859 RepID=UPI003AF6CB01